MKSMLEPHSTKPQSVNILGWKGNTISSLNFHESAAQYPGTFYWDFHRANLHKCLLERALELGATVTCKARVKDVICCEDEAGGTATVVLADGSKMVADLVVGADGINSRLREVMIGKKEPPVKTGDLAYRLLLSTEEMMKDGELRGFVEDPQVNYWLGPDAHAGKHPLCLENPHLLPSPVLPKIFATANSEQPSENTKIPAS
jgi:salicylate hydroxylase